MTQRGSHIQYYKNIILKEMSKWYIIYVCACVRATHIHVRAYVRVCVCVRNIYCAKTHK